MSLPAIITYLFSFLCIWFGAGLIVSAVSRLSHRLHLSPFFISFFLLGLLTSTPEIAVGITSITQGESEIFIGNLIGGVMAIFFFIIPLLAIFGNGIKIKHELSVANLVFSFVTVLSPLAFLVDGQLTRLEGLILVGIYALLAFFIQQSSGLLHSSHRQILKLRVYSLLDLLKVLVGVAVVFISSQIIVKQTLDLASYLHISPFYVSLFALSLGTNIPELSLGLRSVFSGQKDVAFGDFLGSATVNTLLFGLFTLISPALSLSVNHFSTTFLILLVGLGFFYYFSRTHQTISRLEGVGLLAVYAIFFFAQQILII
jgi:cation:H+ antiporter